MSEGVWTLQMNRAEKKNALNTAMYEAMTDALARAETDPDIRVVVFCGVSGCFTAGNDLRDFLARTDMHAPRPAHRFIRALTNVTVPLVAAVGIGTTLLLHCDFIFATARVRFRLPFVDLGFCPEAGSSLLLPRLAGYVQAAELLMLGDAFDGNRAYELGMVTAVSEPDALLEQANTITRVEAEIVQFADLLDLPAAKEIMTAFIEKRAGRNKIRISDNRRTPDKPHATDASCPRRGVADQSKGYFIVSCKVSNCVTAGRTNFSSFGAIFSINCGSLNAAVISSMLSSHSSAMPSNAAHPGPEAVVSRSSL
jgi:enoyl-CoA hydratase/carnithine racemase